MPGHPLYFGMIFLIKSQLAVETQREVAPSHTCSSDEDICNVVVRITKRKWNLVVSAFL